MAGETGATRNVKLKRWPITSCTRSRPASEQAKRLRTAPSEISHLMRHVICLRASRRLRGLFGCACRPISPPLRPGRVVNLAGVGLASRRAGAAIPLAGRIQMRLRAKQSSGPARQVNWTRRGASPLGQVRPSQAEAGPSPFAIRRSPFVSPRPARRAHSASRLIPSGDFWPPTRPHDNDNELNVRLWSGPRQPPGTSFGRQI